MQEAVRWAIGCFVVPAAMTAVRAVPAAPAVRAVRAVRAVLRAFCFPILVCVLGSRNTLSFARLIF